jgi:hypothetical protein
VQGYFLSPTAQKAYSMKRKWPLSEEQCGYLVKVLNEEEIQLIRKFRQLPPGAMGQITGYLDYTWALKGVTMKKS